MAKKRKPDYLSILDNPWSDEDIAAHASYMEERRKQPTPPPSFSNVESGSSTTETQPEELNVLERLLAVQGANTESAVGGLERTFGSLGFTGANGGFTSPLVEAGRQTITNALFGDGTYETQRQEAKNFFGDVVTSGSERAQQAEGMLGAADLPGPVNKVARGVNDVLGSPSSLGSVPGGAFAAIPAADVYAQEYTAAIRAGVDPAEAETYAKAKAGIELGISAIPAGKLFKWGDNFFRGAASNAIRGTIRTAAGEGAEEGITELANAGVDKLLASNADGKLGTYAESQGPKSALDLWNRVERSTIAGAIGGTALGGPMEFIEDAAKAGKMAAELTAKSKDYLDIIEPKTAPVKPRFRVPLPETQVNVPTQLESNPAPVKKPKKKDTDFLEELASGLKQEQIAMPGPQGETARSVINKITSDMSNGQHRQLAARLLRGDVVLVNSDKSIPAGAEARGAAGFYDGKRTYLVATRFNKDQPITGQIMDTLAHETTHAGDVSGFASNKLVGEENNAKLQKLIMDTARKQYGSDDFINIDPASPEFQKLTPEQKATVFAISKTDNSGAAALETTAYYVNFAREAARNQRARKASAAVWQNVKSAVKDTFGLDASLDDVAYLSDKLLRQAAENAPMQGDVATAVENYGGGETDANGLAMIGGPEATGFTTAKEEGRVYTGKVDLQERFEFPDNNSSITDDDFVIQDVMDGNRVRLKDILKHDELYKQYPWIGDTIKVKVDKTLDENTYGYFDGQTLSIAVNPDVLKGKKQRLRKLMLHEIQHVLQAQEGFVKGTNPSVLQDPAVAEEFDKAGNRLSAVPEKFSLGTALKSMTAEDRAAWDKLVQEVEAESGKMNLAELSELFLNEGFGRTSTSRIVQGEQNQYDRASTSFQAAANEKQYDKAKARTLYARDYGETEARNTEFRADMSDAVRAKMPPESTMKFAEGQVAAEDTVDTRPIVAKLRSKATKGLAQSAQTLGYDPESFDTTTPSKMEGVARIAERLLTPGGFLDTDLLEALQHSKGDLAARATDSLFYTNKLREAVDENVKKSNGKYTDESIRQLISKRLEAIDAQEDADVRRSMMAALDRELPGVGKAFEILREFKLGITRDLIGQRRTEILKGGNKMTAKERNVYRKMAKNAERYTTRAYLATYDKDIGHTYGKRMVEAFKKKPDSEEGKVISGAIDWLVKNELMIPDTTTMETFTTEKLRRMYENWIGSSKGIKGDKGKAKMITELGKLNAKSNGELNQKAWEIVQEMLGQTRGKGVVAKKHTPSMRQNRTILEARSKMPEEIRKLLGEITDPLLREAITLNRMTNLAAKTKFLMEMFETGKGRWWSDTKSEKFQTKLTAAGYGPLRDKYVTRDLEDAITGTVAAMQGIDESMEDIVQNGDLVMKVLAGASLPAMRSIMSAQKTNGVVFDIYNGVINLAGAVALMAPLNGLGPVNSGKGMVGAAKVLALDIWDRKLGPEARDVVKELLLAGATDSATMGDLKGHAFDGVKKELSKLGANERISTRKVLTAVWKGATGQHKLGQAMRTAYAFMDVWTKAATYYDRKDFYTNMNTLEGWGLTEEQIIRKAGFDASGTNVSYERAIPLFKTLERNLPLFMFLTYKSETARVIATSYMQVLKDLRMAAQAKNPKAKALAGFYAMKRLTGTAAVSAAVLGATQYMLDTEDDDEKKKRFLDADWMKTKMLLMLGHDKDGKEVLVDLNRIDPLGPVHEAVTAIANAPDNQKWEATGKALEDFFIAKSTGVAAVGQMIWDASVAAAATVEPSLKKHDMYTKKTITENDHKALFDWLQAAPGDLGVNAANVAERLFLPGSLKPLYGTKGEVVEGGLGKVMHNLGANLYVRDPDLSLKMRANEYKDVVKALKAERDEALKSGNLDIDEMNDLVRKEYKSFLTVANGYEGYMAFDNATAAGAIEAINDKKLAAAAKTGHFQSKLIDQSTLNKWYKKELKKKGVDRQEVTETYRELKKLYSEVSPNGDTD